MTGDPYQHACLVAGCSQPVTFRGRCQAHGRSVDTLRGLSSDRLHKALYASARWRRLRALVLSLHPLCQCEECQQTGHVLASRVVHHKQPHGGDETLFFAIDNLQAMAKACHDRLTGAVRSSARGDVPRPRVKAPRETLSSVKGV